MTASARMPRSVWDMGASSVSVDSLDTRTDQACGEISSARRLSSTGPRTVAFRVMMFRWCPYGRGEAGRRPGGRSQPSGRTSESVNGLGFDVEPGQTERTIALAPGEAKVACWAFSDHDSLDEPPTTRLEVLDPRSLYTDPELECPAGDMIGSTISDFIAPGPDPSMRIPLDEAERGARGLRPDDQPVYGGYPEQEQAPVLVVRGGSVVAAFSFAQAEGGA